MDLAKLTVDLVAANEAAREVSLQGEDGGSCNLDTLYVTLPVRYSKRVAEAFTRAGVRLDETPFKGKSRFVWVEYSGQGCSRTRSMEAAHKLLLERGWDCFHIWYYTD